MKINQTTLSHPYLDAAHLIDAFNYWRGTTRNLRTRFAWRVTSHPSTVWKIDRLAFGEFTIMMPVADLLALRPFLRRISASTLSPTETAALRESRIFQDVQRAMRIVAGAHHGPDITHAAYAAADQALFIGDNTFARFVNMSFARSQHARGLSFQVLSMRDFANLLGVP